MHCPEYHGPTQCVSSQSPCTGCCKCLQEETEQVQGTDWMSIFWCWRMFMQSYKYLGGGSLLRSFLVSGILLVQRHTTQNQFSAFGLRYEHYIRCYWQACSTGSSPVPLLRTALTLFVPTSWDDLNLRPNWGEFVSDLGIGWLFGRVNKVTWPSDSRGPLIRAPTTIRFTRQNFQNSLFRNSSGGRR